MWRRSECRRRTSVEVGGELRREKRKKGKKVLARFVSPGTVDQRTVFPRRAFFDAASTRNPTCRRFAARMSLPITTMMITSARGFTKGRRYIQVEEELMCFKLSRCWASVLVLVKSLTM